MCQVDAEVIWRKKVCHCTLLSMSPTSEALTKGPSFEILTPTGLEQSYPLFPPSMAVICQIPTNHTMYWNHFIPVYHFSIHLEQLSS